MDLSLILLTVDLRQLLKNNQFEADESRGSVRFHALYHHTNDDFK